jgi:hypothetical protein
MKKLFTSIFLAIALVACAGAPQTPQQTIYSATTSYNAAATVIIAYKALPACGQPTSPILCSKADVITKLKQADAAAYTALVEAEKVARMEGAGANAATALAAANGAIAALTSITASLSIK